ncbi:hypothetical protein NECID01_0382 [Nematocida sp. AWRm77]|nr:hypothetical protein NECID01_0382 [Nematocida sp. AWRm77]
MTQYHAKGRGLLGRTLLALLASTGVLAQNAMPAIGSTASMQPFCPPNLMKGLGGMSVGGMGGGMGGLGSGMGSNFDMNAPTICIKQGQTITPPLSGKAASMLKQITNFEAIRALMNLHNNDCKKKKVSPASQICFLVNAITKKAKTPTHTVSRLKNAMVITKQEIPVMMIIVERFGSMKPQDPKPVSVEELFNTEVSKTVYNEFDDKLHSSGPKHLPKQYTMCQECLKKLKEGLTFGDVDCDCNDNSLSIDLDDFKNLK